MEVTETPVASSSTVESNDPFSYYRWGVGGGGGERKVIGTELKKKNI
jgi:hypothetical protein